MLSDIEARKAEPQDKPYKLTDGKGLYLLIQPNGAKFWRMNYRHGGKQKTIALGTYPEISLAKARDRLDDATASTPWQSARLPGKRTKNSFEAIAREWLETNRGKWVGTTRHG